LEQLYKDTIEVLRNTQVTDSGGSGTESEVIDSTIIGLIVPVKSSARFQFGQHSLNEATHRLYCGIASDILNSDKLRSPITSGTVYEVLTVDESVLGSNAHKEVELKRIIS